MTFLETKTLTLNQKREIISLWNKVAPAAIAHESMEAFDKYVESLNNVTYTLVLDDETCIVGWFGDFDRDQDRWFAMLLDPSIHGQGIGSELLTRAKSRHKTLSGWVIDHDKDKTLKGHPYISPVNFYLKNGFELIAGVRLELPHLSCVQMRWHKGK